MSMSKLEETDFCDMKHKLFARLIARGHCQYDILPIFQDALLRLGKTKHPNQIQNTDNKKINDKILFFKFLYHPNDIPRNVIQSTYHTHCSMPYKPSQQNSYDSDDDDKDILADTTLTIAFSRDKNLRDLLIPTNIRNDISY